MSGRSALLGGLVAAALVAANLWAWRGVVGLGFTDTDALADLAAARVDGPGEALALLWTPLTGGVGGSNANFYRPVVMLHYALMRGLFGANPLGWQLWDLGLHALATGLLATVVGAAGGGLWARLGAAALFSLHPLAVEVTPAVARNLDAVMAVFALGSVWAMLSHRRALAVGLGLLALGSKETAVVLPLVALGLWGRDGLRPLLAWGVGLGLFLVARTSVLEGLGGYYAAQNTLNPQGIPGALSRAAFESLAPGWSGPLTAVVPEPLRLPLGLGAVGVALVAAAVQAWRGQGRAALGLALWVLPVLLYGLTGTYSRRLLYLPTAGLALGVSSARGPAGLVLVGLWALTLLPASPLVHPYTDWAANDRLTRSLTTGVQDQLAALPPGTTVWVLDRCVRMDAEPLRARIWAPGRTLNNCVASYSLQAWADDQLGPGRVRLRMLTSILPRGPVPAPRVQVGSGWLSVEGPPMGRVLTPAAKDAGFEAERVDQTWTLRVPAARAGERALVAGGDAGALVVLR